MPSLEAKHELCCCSVYTILRVGERSAKRIELINCLVPRQDILHVVLLF